MAGAATRPLATILVVSFLDSSGVASWLPSWLPFHCHLIRFPVSGVVSLVDIPNWPFWPPSPPASGRTSASRRARPPGVEPHAGYVLLLLLLRIWHVGGALRRVPGHLRRRQATEHRRSPAPDLVERLFGLATCRSGFHFFAFKLFGPPHDGLASSKARKAAGEKQNSADSLATDHLESKRRNFEVPHDALANDNAPKRSELREERRRQTGHQQREESHRGEARRRPGQPRRAAREDDAAAWPPWELLYLEDMLVPVRLWRSGTATRSRTSWPSSSETACMRLIHFIHEHYHYHRH